MNNLPQNPQSSQTDVSPRAVINQEIAEKWELIDQIKNEINNLKKEAILLCDETQWFSEVYEDILISKRPKKSEKRLIGKVYWKEEFKDESTNESIWIVRSEIVRVNGVWLTSGYV